MSTRRLTGEAVVYGIGRATDAAAAFLTLPVLFRALGPAEVGIADVITASAGIAFFLVGLNLDQALVRYYYDSDRRLLATIHLLSIAGNGALFLAFAFAAIAVVDRLPVPAAWVLAAICVPLTIAIEHAATLFRLRHEPFRYLALVAANSLGWAVGMIAFLVTTDFGILAIFAGRIAGAFLAIAVVLPWLRTAYAAGIERHYYRRALRFAVPTIPAALAATLIIYGQRYYLGFASTAEEIGFFGVGARFAYLLATVGIAASMAWLPFAMEMQDREDARRVLGTGILVYAGGCVALAAPICLFATELVTFVMGERYLPGAPSVAILTVAMVFSNLMLVQFAQVSIAERTHWQTTAYLAGATVTFGLDLLLGARWGSVGAALATFGGFAVAAAVNFAAAQRCFPVAIDGRRTAAIVALAIALAFAGNWLATSPGAGTGAIIRLAALAAVWLAIATAVGRERLATIVAVGRNLASRRVTA